MIIHKCDKCGKLVEQKKGEWAFTPTEFVPISIGNSYESSARALYEVCDQCADGLGIPKESRAKVKYVGDQLIEILSDIAREAVQE